MGNSEQSRMKDEIERLRQALDAQTQTCLDLQRQLDRTNTEFEQFVSTAAHNLRESLRDVMAFSQLLAEAQSAQPGSETGAFLEHLREGAAKMQALLADIVDFWSMGAGNRQPAPADLEAALRHALLCEEKRIAERGATVTHDPLPRVNGDSEMLTKVLRHLIRNAIEYCDAPAPLVHISSRREGDAWTISVQDNGPGIEPQFRSRIFEPFKRLHGKQYPGNGLGLAYCRKAVEWHEGRIWVESAPGAGSTFCFTLPPAD